MGSRLMFPGCPHSTVCTPCTPEVTDLSSSQLNPSMKRFFDFLGGTLTVFVLLYFRVGGTELLHLDSCGRPSSS